MKKRRKEKTMMMTCQMCQCLFKALASNVKRGYGKASL